MKRVLQISKYYYPFIGGTEQVAKDIAEALKSYNYEQKVICFNEDAESETAVCRKKETIHDIVDGVEIIRCGYFAKVASQSLSASFGREFKRLMNDFQPDIVILHYPNPFAAHYLMKYKKRPFKLLIYWHLDITKQKFLKKFFHRQNINLIKRADRILGATPIHVDQSEYSEYFEEKKEILPYAINEARLKITVDEIKKANNIKEKYKEQVLCFFAGRHVPYKGLNYLIKSALLLKDSNIYFLIAGQGELTEELKVQAAGNSKVKFLGRISDSEWRSYLYASDIFCFPSITRNEGFGLALAEGMYFEKPAVTYTIVGSGVNYVNLANITGIECPNKDYKAYAEALLLLSQNEELRNRYGEKARERIAENFTFDKFNVNLESLLQRLEKENK